MTRRILFCAAILFLCIHGVSAARYQRCKDGKTLVWNSLRGVAQDANWSGLHDLNGYATGEGTLTWYRLGAIVNSYTGKMVRGKFEGPVIRQQASTRLQANFTNGEQVSGWSEPGSSPVAIERPAPNEPAQRAEESPTESPSSIPAPIPSPTPTATERPSPIPTPTARTTPSPTPTPRSSPTPTPTPTATLRPSPSPTPTPSLRSSTPTPTPRTTSMSTPMGMPALMPTATPTPQPSLRPSLAESPTVEPSTPAGEGSANILEPARSPEPELKIEQAPRISATPIPRITTPAAQPDGSRKLDPNAKRQLIAEFKKEIDTVFGEVKGATNSFREIDSLEQVKPLPKAVSAHVTLLTASAGEFRAIVGYDVTFYECLAEIQTVDALLVVDQSTSIIAAKDTPIARKILATFRDRYSKAPAEAQKPLWRYIDSMYAVCDRLKKEAEARLPRARSLESEGKKADALREYREINKIYPNKVTAERIRMLEAQSR